MFQPRGIAIMVDSEGIFMMKVWGMFGSGGFCFKWWVYFDEPV